MRVIDRRRLSGKQTNCRRNLGADGRAATATLNLVKTIKPSRSKIVDEAPLLLDGLSPLQQRLVSRPSSRERIGDRGNGYFIHPPRLVVSRAIRPAARIGPPNAAGEPGRASRLSASCGGPSADREAAGPDRHGRRAVGTGKEGHEDPSCPLVPGVGVGAGGFRPDAGGLGAGAQSLEARDSLEDRPIQLYRTLGFTDEVYWRRSYAPPA